jgi:hypothetical protein
LFSSLALIEWLLVRTLAQLQRCPARSKRREAACLLLRVRDEQPVTHLQT